MPRINGKWAHCVDPTKYMDRLDKGNKASHLKLFEKVSNIWEKDPMLKRFGWDKDGEMMLQRFIYATDKDPMAFAITKSDVKNFELYIKNYSSSLEKGFDTRFVNWKVLRDKLKRMPGGEELTRDIYQILGYQRRHNQINSGQLAIMQRTTKKLAKEFGVDLGELTKLEIELSNASDPNVQANIEAKIYDYLQGKSKSGMKMASGDLHLGITDVMQGTRPEDLMKTVNGQRVPWSGKEVALAKKMQNAWYYIRKDMTKVAISALRTEKKTARLIDKEEGGVRGLENYLDMLQNKIVELELSKGQSTKGKEWNIYGKEMRELGARTEEQMSLNTDLGYMPHHILTLTSHLKEFNNYMHTPLEAPADVRFKEVIGWYDKVKGSVGVDRLKSRNPNAEGYYSNNPFMFVSKYIYDISKYNHDVQMQKVLMDTSSKLMYARDSAIKGSYDQEVIDITDSGLKLLKTLSEESFIGGTQGGLDKSSNGEPNSQFAAKATRALTTFQFIRTMGANIKGATKNLLGGKVLDWAQQGWAVKRFANRYLTTYDAMDGYNRQLEQHGLFWDKESGIGQKFISEYSKAAATRGTYEEGVLPPGLKEKEINGQRVLVITDQTKFDRTLQFMEGVATTASFFHKYAENILRPNAFRGSYAAVHSNLMSMPDSYIQYRMKRKKGDFESEQKWLERKANWIEKQAGLEAFNAVELSQFEYGKVAKANVLKSKKGQTIGQYQHYRFSIASHMKELFVNGSRAIKAGALTGDLKAIMGSNLSSREVYRLGGIYSMLGTVQFLTGAGILGLAQNDLWGLGKQIGTIVSADMETEEGRNAVEKATFGVGAVTLAGPNIGLGLEIGRVTGLMQENPTNKFIMLSFMDGEPMNESEYHRKMRIARLFNIEAARFGGQVLPSILREDYGKAFGQQFGLFTDYDERKKRNNTIRPYLQYTRAKLGVSAPYRERMAFKTPNIGDGSPNIAIELDKKAKDDAVYGYRERALETLKLF